MKQFIYFENQEGGMGTYVVSCKEELPHLYGWMQDDCKQDDEALLSWMDDADVGEMYEHRLGAMVRLKGDSKVTQ